MATGWGCACQGEWRGGHALFVLASAPGRILSRMFLSAPCQNIWCELPAARRRWVPSFEGTGRGGTGRDAATFCRRSRGAGSKGVSAPHVDAAFPSLHPRLHTAVTLKKKITVHFPDDAGRRNRTTVTSVGHSSCLSSATCAHICRDPGQVVSPGMKRPCGGDPLQPHPCCLEGEEMAGSHKSSSFPSSLCFSIPLQNRQRELGTAVGPGQAVRFRPRAQQGQGRIQCTSA